MELHNIIQNTTAEFFWCILEVKIVYFFQYCDSKGIMHTSKEIICQKPHLLDRNKKNLQCLKFSVQLEPRNK